MSYKTALKDQFLSKTTSTPQINVESNVSLTSIPLGMMHSGLSGRSTRSTPNTARNTRSATGARGAIFICFTFIEPRGASHGELDQSFPQFQADRPQSVKVYGRIEGHWGARAKLQHAPSNVNRLYAWR